MATRQYVLVSLAKQPISLFFSKAALTAMMKTEEEVDDLPVKHLKTSSDGLKPEVTPFCLFTWIFTSADNQLTG